MSQFSFSGFLLVSALFALTGCSAANSTKPKPDTTAKSSNQVQDFSRSDAKASSRQVHEVAQTSAGQVRMMLEHPPETQDEANAQLEKLGRHWFYGPGIGKTMVNVGGVIVFPPYALYLLGNAGLTLAGYDPISPTQILPSPVEEAVDGAYDSATSLPGRLNAAVMGEEYIP